MNRVAVYESENFEGELIHFKPFECTVNKASRAIKAPMESGQVSVDNKVVDPITIKISGKIDLNGVFAQSTITKLNNMFKNRKASFYSVTTKDAAYERMMMLNCTDKNVDNEYDCVRYELEFIEAMIVQGEGVNALDQSNNNYLARGFVNPIIL